MKNIKKRVKRLTAIFLFILVLCYQGMNSSSLVYASTNGAFSLTQQEINEIEHVIKNCGSGVSVFYQDIISGYTYTYNPNQKYFIASVIKAPYCMYIYQLASEGKCDLNKKYTYASRHTYGGTGKIQNMKLGSTFTMRELLQYAIKYSDNVAMSMIREAYPVSGYKQYAKGLGLTYMDDIKNATDGMITARDAGAYIRAINKFIKENTYGSELKTLMSSTTNPMIVSTYPVIRKYGWAEKSFHDIAIIEAPRPYLLCILTNHDGDFNTFKKISKAIEKVSQKEGGQIAYQSSNKIMCQGIELPLSTYQIDGCNYVSIRELESILKETNMAIQIEWRENTLYIEESGEGLEIQNANLSSISKHNVEGPVEAIKKECKVYWQGGEIPTEVYQINGNTYLKLRVISDALKLKIKLSEDDNLIELYS